MKLRGYLSALALVCYTYPLSLLVLGTSQAGTYNYRSIIPGERAAGMGGAYTALSNTPEGAYYNPAGLAFIEHTSVSVSGNIYGFTDGSRTNGLQIAGVKENLDQDSFNSIPQLAAVARKFRFPWENSDTPMLNAVAFSAIVTEKIDLNGRVDFNVNSGEALLDRSFEDQTLYVGPSYARRISENFAIGASLFLELRQLDATGFLLQDTPDIFLQLDTHVRQTVGNLIGQIGVRYSPLENFWIGANYQLPTVKIFGSGFVFASAIAVDRDTDEIDTAKFDEKDLSPHAEQPPQLNIGVAYAKPMAWTLAADGILHFGNHFSLFDGSNFAVVQQDPIINFSVGGEYYCTDIFLLRAGVFSDLSSATSVQAGALDQLDQIDFYGFSLMASLERQNTTISLGTVMSFGDGLGVDNLGNKVPVERNNYNIILAGTFRL